MPAGDNLPPLFDPGNSLLSSGTPHSHVAGTIPGPAGDIGVLTIRTPNCTLTVTLTRRQAAQWAEDLAELRDSLPAGSGLITARPGGVLRFDGPPGRPAP